jgi:hypothetical protein
MVMTSRDLAVMLSPASLAAFSTSVAHTGLSQSGLVHRTRLAGTQQQPASPAAPAPAPPTTRGGGAATDRPLPRGSLLDLSV